MLTTFTKSTKECVLAFHYQTPFFRNPDGSYRTFSYLGRFLDSLAPYWRRIDVLAHVVSADNGMFDFEVKNPKLRIIDLGPKRMAPLRLLQYYEFKRLTSKYSNQWDALMFRLPTILAAPIAAGAPKVPLIQLIIGDPRTLSVGSEAGFPKRQFMFFNGHLMNRQIKALCQRGISFVNSPILYQRYMLYSQYIINIKTSSLSAKDFYETADRCLNATTRLLFVGRIDRSKGIHDLIDAVAILRRGGRDIILDIIGIMEKQQSYFSELQDQVKALELEDFIMFQGYKPLGAELFDFYRQADILILPSYKEAMPRVLWEAGAFSVPIVATAVGGIPFYFSHEKNALLISPGKPEEISHSVARIIEEKGLRQRMIKNAREIAIDNTLESNSEKMHQEINRFMEMSKYER